MTFTNQTNRTSATGSGSTGQEVAFGFPISVTTDLTVYKRVTATGVQTTLAETTNYTVSISGDTGGTLTTVTAIETTEQIHIVRTTPYTQSLDLEAGGTFNAENQEDAFDKNTKLSIQVRDAVGRSLRFPETDPTTSLTELPNSIDRAGYALGFDSITGAPSAMSALPTSTVTVSAFMETVLDDATALAGMATLQGRSVINVMNPTYNVQADGATDDTTGLQAAADALAAGQALFFPKGIYIYSTLSITTSNVMFFGEGRGSLLKQKAGTTDNGFILTGADGFVMRDMAFNGNALDNRQVRIDGDTDGGLIDNIYISNCTDPGLDIQGSSTNIDVLNSTFTACEYGAFTATATSSLITFTNCKFISNTVDGMLLVNTTGAKFTNCDFNSNTQDGFSAGASTTDIQLDNCRAISNGHDGFDFTRTVNAICTNCTANNNTVHGFNPSAACDGIQLIGCTAKDNTLSGVGIFQALEVTIIGGNFTSNNGLGIDINNGTNIQVIGARCDDNDHDGIDCKNTSTYVQLIGNRCFDNNQDSLTYNGIYLVDTTDSIVMGNLCYNVAGSTQIRGIHEFTGCQRNVITGNNCFSNATGQIGANSSSTIVTNNIGSSSMAVTEGYVVSYENSTVFYENEIVQSYGGTYRD